MHGRCSPTSRSRDAADGVVDEIASANWSPVCAYAYRLATNRSDAEDVAQDVFVRASTSPRRASRPTWAPGASHHAQPLYRRGCGTSDASPLPTLPHSFDP